MYNTKNNPMPLYLSARLGRILLSSLLLLLLSFGVQAQDSNTPPVDSATTKKAQSNPQKTKKVRTKPTPLPEDETTFLNHFGIGASIGTRNFVGGDLVINIISQLNVRLGYNQFDLAFSDVETSISGFTNQNLSFDGRIQQNNLEVLFEWGILDSRLRFVAGPVITLDNQISTDFRLTEDVQINDITIPAEEVGAGSVMVDHSLSVFPYVGIGIGRSLPWRRVGVSLDIGTYYKGITRVNLAANGLIQANADNETIINRNLREEIALSLWPVVSFRVAYRIF